MFKKYRGSLLIIILVAAFTIIAAKPKYISHVLDLWVGDKTATSDLTVGKGDGDVYIEGTLEVDDAVRLDGAIDANSTMNISGVLTAAGGVTDITGGVTSGEIANVTRSFPLHLSAAYIDDSGPITSAGCSKLTMPYMETRDNIPKMIFDDSTVTTGVQWTFRVPPDYYSGGGVRLLISSDQATGSNVGFDYLWWINADDTNFAGTEYGEYVRYGSGSYINDSNEVIDLSMNATAVANMTAGRFITFELFFSSSHSTADGEIGAAEYYYEAIQ